MGPRIRLKLVGAGTGADTGAGPEDLGLTSGLGFADGGQAKPSVRRGGEGEREDAGGGEGPTVTELDGSGDGPAEGPMDWPIDAGAERPIAGATELSTSESEPNRSESFCCFLTG